LKRNQNDELLNSGIIDMELAAEEEVIKSRRFKYGTLATIFTIVFICAVVIVNVFLGYMTKRFVWEIDMTSEKLFEISEDTKEVIDDLNMPVTITVLADETTYRDSTQLLSNIYEILQRYESLGGGKINVRYLNPNLNPKLLDRYNTLGDLSNNYIIVESDLRYTYMAPTSLYNMKTDKETGIQYYVGLRAEQALTSALIFVTSDSVNTAAYIRGHGEDYYMNEMDALLKTMNYDVTDIVLALDDIPEEVTMIIIASPTTDYSMAEIDKLDSYLKNGGDAIIALSPYTSDALPNLTLLFEEWGVRYTNNMVLDSSRYITMPFAVAPYIDYVENVTDKLNTKNYVAVVPGCIQLELTGTQTGSHTVVRLMSSGDTSYAKSFDSVNKGYDKLEDDPVGPFNMAVISEYYVTDKNLNYTRGDIFFCSAGLIGDSVLKESNFLNKQFLYHVINYISEYDDAVVIKDKDFVSTNLTILGGQARAVFWIIVVALPLAILATGIVIWARRKHL
jgi:ABC-2 type transport system permease protein